MAQTHPTTDSAEAFYVARGGGVFTPTAHTTGPWSPDAQHFGPPSALLVRGLEQIAAERPMQLARVTVEIHGPAPLTDLTLTSELVRPGRSVELLTARLVSTTGGAVVASASAWRIATSDSARVRTGEAAPLTAPEDCPPVEWPEDWHGGETGYLAAMEWRRVDGAVQEPGPATVWARQRVALVAGEEPTPMQRLLAVADSGNGASNELDMRRWWFINSELTVHAHRQPEGEWIGLDAHTVLGPHGVGTARSTLHDVGGQVGGGAQALLVRHR
ncbi:TesB-like acyl-CoA thioesterase 5 [Saccharomonospora sp. CUA-673]|uniref:thioesterase family protein n=1 Tax=Saccharomonospora sp. CUA-673 TaxID=1904969 RepID=UPI00095BADB0|nr:thioesterase family protein [Saccharomonospora sp. CUA-673]OLT46725.1 TesB-like acyl-CoA thioesterase 5 [Saccharomonospora sp. CUA-673]